MFKAEANRRSYNPFDPSQGERYTAVKKAKIKKPVDNNDASTIFETVQYVYENMAYTPESAFEVQYSFIAYFCLSNDLLVRSLWNVWNINE